VVDEREQLDPTVRNLITHGWELYHLPYSPVNWQEARRNSDRAFELDSRSTEARIGASMLSTKLADGWSPVLQEDMPRAEHLLREAMIGEVLRTGQRPTLRLGCSARCRPGCLRLRPSSRRQFPSTPTTPGPIRIWVRPYCISVNPRPPSHRSNRQSGFARMTPHRDDVLGIGCVSAFAGPDGSSDRSAANFTCRERSIVGAVPISGRGRWPEERSRQSTNSSARGVTTSETCREITRRDAGRKSVAQQSAILGIAGKDA
jgi:hypothetical protein